MRVMTREVNQGVIINGNVNVTVLEILEDRVRLGIAFPRPDAPHLFDYHEETVRLELTEPEPEPLEAVR